MKCIIVDDEYPARALLEDYVGRIPYLDLVATCKNTEEAKAYLRSHPVDLMFMDIQMPGEKGTTFLRSLENKPLAIMTTAYSDYALEGYELEVVDYLVKPISFERFMKATEKAYSRFKSNSALVEPSYIYLKADHKVHKVDVAEIIYIEGAREYVIFHLVSGKIMSLEALKNLEETLPEYFIRIHKSFIVNRNKVTALHGGYVEVGEIRLPIGKAYRTASRSIF